jgi:murein DD-endopeptidase MepM/ murein hydrolase activator NlpD
MKIGLNPEIPRTEPRNVAAACRQFEGLLVSELFKVMRRSVPKSALSSGLSNDVFTSMLDEQLARHIAESGGLGLGSIVAQQLAGGAEVPPHLLERLQDGTWVRPTPHSNLSLSPAQQFGAPRGHRGHRGMDIGGRTGTPVVASGAGTVAAINRDLESTGGLSLVISHPGNLSTSYVHLDSIREGLSVGQSVVAGEPVGTLGATGTGAKGSHLHFAIRAEIGGRTVHLDPEPHVRGWPTSDQAR